MSVLFSWLQTNWLEATMLIASIAAVIATIVAVRVAVLALGVAKRSAQSADEAHERNVRLQARIVLAEAHSSFERLSRACNVNRVKWEQYRLRNAPLLSSNFFATTDEMKELSSLRMQACQILRVSTENLQHIEEMELCDLENAIPKARHATSTIDALAQHIQEPRGAFQ